ncbi:unnamed protein product [Citrullus colocynthis]|uniref:Transmembrane protein n=1 Tax=Citrullus colocynthis TaxID=252529 RepID=A0ABP0YTW5_9ROSI
MASQGRDGEGFPAVDVDRELSTGHNKHVEVDPISSEVAASLEVKEHEKRKAAEEERKRAKKKEAMQTLKTTFIISGIIAAVAVATFAIVKKLREN